MKKAWHQQTKIKKVEYAGHSFDSVMEKDFYIFLVSGRYLEGIGELQKVELQPRFILIPAHEKNGRQVRPMIYKADFRIDYINHKGETVTEVIDVKGFPTVDFKLKKKIFEYFYPYELTVITQFPKKHGGHFGLLSDLDKLKAQEKRAKNGKKPKKNGQSKKAATKRVSRKHMGRGV